MTRVVPSLARVALPAAAGIAAATFGPGPAAADPPEIGGLLGPRLFAADSRLGDNDEHPELETSLSNSVVLGGRLSVPVTSWLVPEAELVLSPATTRAGDVSVFWFAPRAHARLQWSTGRLRPFIVVGGAMPVVLSSKRGIYPTGFTGEGYGGGGVLWAPGRGLSLRLDARLAVGPARVEPEQSPVTIEGEVTLGVWFPLGGGAAAARARRVEPPPPPSDRDGDGYPDDADGCPDRAEDHDGFDDKDGCPDIDNDGDQVLDLADKCPTVAELYNGFEDDDGCPDTVSPDVDLIIGTVEGLLYREGEAEVRATASAGLDRIAATLQRHPSVRLVLIGHTDDREALAGAKAPPGGDPPDADQLARDLGMARAAAVRDELVRRGFARGRFVVASAGADQPVSDDDSNRGRLRNRRVEVKLFVPKR